MSEILYVGTYERDYPRNALTVAALRRAGFAVREIHAPVWDHVQDKSGFTNPARWPRLALALLRAYVSLGLRLRRQLARTDAVAIGYIGQLDMLLLGWLVRLAGRPLIFNPLVTLTDTLVDDRRLVRAGGLVARVIALVDRLALRQATLILVDTPENGAYLTRTFGVGPERIRAIPVGADARVFALDRSPSVESAPRAVEPLRVLFYGKMIPLHGVETIVRAVGLCAERFPLAVEIVGLGQTWDRSRELASAMGLDEITFTPWVPFEQLPERIRAADVVLGIFGDTEKAARVVPNKVYQAMVMGAAIVTRDSPAIRSMLTNGRSALLVPPDDPDALAAALDRLRDPELRAALGREARAVFEQKASLDALASRLAAALAPVLSSAEAAPSPEAAG